MIPVGFMQAAIFLVGKYLGKGRVDLAKQIAGLIRIISLGWSLASFFLIIILKEPIMSLYTNEEEVKEVMRSAWFALSIFVFFDCMQGVINGIVTGLNIMSKVKFVTMFTYWGLGIPLSLYLMFKADLGIEGLWFGPALAVCLNYLFYEYNICIVDW